MAGVAEAAAAVEAAAAEINPDFSCDPTDRTSPIVTQSRNACRGGVVDALSHVHTDLGTSMNPDNHGCWKTERQ